MEQTPKTNSAIKTLYEGHDWQLSVQGPWRARPPIIPCLIFLTIAGYTPSLECCKITPYLDVHQRDRIWQNSKNNLCSISDKTYNNAHWHVITYLGTLRCHVWVMLFLLRVTSGPKWQFQRLKQPTFWILRGANITSLTYHSPRGTPSLTCFPAQATTEKNELIIPIAFVYFAFFSWFQTTHCGWPAFNDQLCGPHTFLR